MDHIFFGHRDSKLLDRYCIFDGNSYYMDSILLRVYYVSKIWL